MNDIPSKALEEILQPVIREAALKIYEREKTKALKELEVSFECAKSDILAACAVEISQRMAAHTTETEFVIRVKR